MKITETHKGERFLLANLILLNERIGLLAVSEKRLNLCWGKESGECGKGPLIHSINSAHI